MATTQAKHSIESFMIDVKKKNPAQHDFHQAVFEVVESVLPFIEQHTKYQKAKISRYGPPRYGPPRYGLSEGSSGPIKRFVAVDPLECIRTDIIIMRHYVKRQIRIITI